MSEFQTQDSLERLLSDVSLDNHGSILVSAVRKDPFAVVLLDEFEKAALPIRDLFLQVFDDGRLTDQHGRLVDFRRCVIVLTSNVGSAIVRGGGVGFAQTADPFRPQKVLEALRKSFRPEFLNRLDRVVVFRPFERAQMRALLDKELAVVLARRGLRSRPWAVELDESAYEFIIEQGFSPELGARPLKRAVERHLLAPLAAAIVEQTVPEGDQFLLVSAPGGERIDATFVDPDADDEAPAASPDAEPESDRALDLRSLARAPRGDERATRFLLEELTRISTAIRGEELQERKQAALEAINQPSFWDEDGRFAVLAEAEYLDRLDAALDTAGKLGERLARRTGRNGRGSLELAELLARRLYVLDNALIGLADGAPTDVFLRIRPAGEGQSPEGPAFAELLVAMYTAWAEQRGMRLTRLGTSDGEHLFEVSGLGCGAILAPEAGLHLLELPSAREGSSGERAHVLVQVAPCEPGPALDRAALARRARETLERQPAAPSVVRRYRREPSLLVRDAARGYRTGRLDRVLAGDFDLF
jgi:ATP-dependent Clp protease ATP-binding subunit ClpC